MDADLAAFAALRNQVNLAARQADLLEVQWRAGKYLHAVPPQRRQPSLAGGTVQAHSMQAVMFVQPRSVQISRELVQKITLLTLYVHTA
jgi:hypothetical protein